MVPPPTNVWVTLVEVVVAEVEVLPSKAFASLVHTALASVGPESEASK